MESAMFLADVISFVLLIFAVVRGIRAGGEPSLGLFAYKDIVRQKPVKNGNASAGGADQGSYDA